MKRPNCHARQYGDQFICSPCGLTWDTNDPEPPDCRKNIKRGIAKVVKFEKALKHIEFNVARVLPDKLPDDVAAEMVKGYQANGMQAAYRIFLDRMGL